MESSTAPKSEEVAESLLNSAANADSPKDPAGSSIQVAIVGAGIAGIACARTLIDHGFAVTVFDKARGVGGRMSYRRGPDGLTFNHGAQYFTAKSTQFRRLIDSMIAAKVVQKWEGKLVTIGQDGCAGSSNDQTRFVGTPGMNAVAKHMAKAVDVRLQSKVTDVSLEKAGWSIQLEGEIISGFDQLVVALPASQVDELFRQPQPFADRCQAVTMLPTIAAMVAFDHRLNTEFDAAFVKDSNLAWVMRNPNPGHSHDCWTLHGTHEWSLDNLERDPNDSANDLVVEFLQLIHEEKLKRLISRDIVGDLPLRRIR